MKGSILGSKLFQSYEYLRYMLLKGLDMAFDVWLMKRGRERKRKVNKLLRTKEEWNYKDTIGKHKEKVALTSVVHLEFIQGELKYLY